MSVTTHDEAAIPLDITRRAVRVTWIAAAVWLVVDFATAAILDTGSVLDNASVFSYTLWAIVLLLAWYSLSTSAVVLLIGATIAVPFVGATLELIVLVIGFAVLTSVYESQTFRNFYTAIVLLWGLYAFGWMITVDPQGSLSDLWLYIPLFAAPILAGVLIGTQFRKNRKRRIAAEEELQRSETEHVAALKELRRGLARDLHDIVAHDLTLIRTQAQAVADFEASAEVTQALTNISDASRTALVDLRRLLMVLGNEGAVAENASNAPTLSLESGIERFSRSLQELGYTTEVHCDGEVAAVSQAAQATLYRVLQECITNVIKYGASHPDEETLDCTIGLHIFDEYITLEIRNRIAVRQKAATGAGLGLRSCQERIEGLGGTFTAGRQSSEWWVVRSRVFAG